MDQKNWYSLTESQVEKEFDTSLENGLESSKITENLEKYR